MCNNRNIAVARFAALYELQLSAGPNEPNESQLLLRPIATKHRDGNCVTTALPHVSLVQWTFDSNLRVYLSNVEDQPFCFRIISPQLSKCSDI